MATPAHLLALSKELCITKDLPCMVCQVRHSTLNNPARNPYGAKLMMIHHHGIEWACASNVNEGHFNKVLRPILASRHKDDLMYQQNMTTAQFNDWLNHSEHNLWVLCDIHHRLLVGDK